MHSLCHPVLSASLIVSLLLPIVLSLQAGMRNSSTAPCVPANAHFAERVRRVACRETGG